MRCKFLTVLIIGLIFLFSNVSSPFARTVTLSWNPNTENDLAGYKVFVGLASAEYDTFYTVDNVNEYQLNLPSDEDDYYLALKAFDFSGNESGFSAEVVVEGNASNPPSESQQAEEYTSLYAYYGRPFYTYGSGDITCDEGLLNDERYQSCEERDDQNKYFYTLTGYKEIHDLTDSRVICQRDESLGGCTPDSSVSFSLSYPMGTRRLPAAFRLYIPPGTLRVNLSIKMNNSSADGIVLRYQNTPDCLGWPYRNYDAVPWAENGNAGLEEMKAGDVYKPNPGGSIFALPITRFSAPLDESGAGWLYVRDLGLDSSEIRTVTFNVTVNSAVFLDWYLNARWDVAGDPWSADHGVTSDLVDCWTGGGIWYNGECRQSVPGSGSGYSPPSGSGPSGSSSPPSSSTSSSGSSSSGSASFSGLGSLFGLQAPCGPDNPGGCDQGECEELGAGYWWYGSCRPGQQIETYDDGRIAQAPVRLGEDADDGTISAGDGMSIHLDVPGNVRTYAVLVFPNDDHLYFIDNNRVITPSVVPVTSGEVPVSNNLCADLEGFPELAGEWLVAFLTVPASVEPFQSLNDIVDYLNSGGVYHFGSYGVMVGCQ